MGVLEQIRSTSSLDDIENIMNSYTYQASDAPYLTNDLITVTGQLADTFLTMRNSTDPASFYQIKDKAIQDFYADVIVHRILQDKNLLGSPELANYVFIHDGFNQIVTNIKNSTYTDFSTLMDSYLAWWSDNVKPIVDETKQTAENAWQDVKDTTNTIITGTSNAYNAGMQWLEKKGEQLGNMGSDIANSIISTLEKIGICIGLGVVTFYVGKKAIDHAFSKKNPLLMQVNPPTDDLYNYARRLKSDITRSDFDRAVKVFQAQHGRIPQSHELQLVNTPQGVNLPILVEVGKVPDLLYIPPSGRKSPYHYKHDMESTKLVTDSSGQALLLLGKTYLSTYDGWLHK